MNMRLTALAMIVCLAAGCAKRADEQKAYEHKTLKDDKEKESYAIGLTLGRYLKQQEIPLDNDIILQGINDTIAGRPPLLTEPDMRAAIAKIQEALAARQQERVKQLAQIAESNKQQGEAFLAANKTNAGVITLTNGLQYKIIQDGDGPVPKPEDAVTVNYRGTFIDGVEFGSTARAGKPLTFRVNGLFPGWTEALTRMKTGSKWQLFIPSNLAYGTTGSPPAIAPNATLLVEVELLSIHPPTATPAQPQPLTSDIIKVPSLEEMQKGAQIETIKAEDLEKLQKQPAPQQK